LVDADPAFADRAVHAFADADVALEAVAEDARALVRARELGPDLVILAERPDGSAFALCNRLRKTAELAETRVAILVADPEGDAARAHRNGPTPADLYLPRPADADLLLAAVGPALGLEIDAVEDEEILAVDEPDEELAALRAEAAEHRRALDDLERTVLGLQEELRQERETAAGLAARADDAETRAKSLSEVLDDSLSEREDSDRAWTARLAEAEAAAAAAREEADRAHLAAAEARAEAEVARRDAAEARAEVEAARAEVDAAKIEAIEARGEAEAASAEVLEGHKELEAVRAEGEALSRELASARDALAASLGAVAEAPLDAAPDLEELERELALARAERERMQDELGAELSKLAHDLAVKDGELAAARRRTSQLENAVRSLGAERDRLAAERTPDGDAAAAIARLEAELEDLRGENAFLGTEVDRYAARVRELRREGDPG
jgi:DNA-binding response OmpR family regulator